jgi:hypothetical protein
MQRPVALSIRSTKTAIDDATAFDREPGLIEVEQSWCCARERHRMTADQPSWKTLETKTVMRRQAVDEGSDGRP